jgi:hypothetical protein
MATVRELVVKLTAKGGARTTKTIKETREAIKSTGDAAKKAAREQAAAAKAADQYAKRVKAGYNKIATLAKAAAMGTGVLVAAQGMLLAQSALYAEEIKRFAAGFMTTVEKAQEYREAFMVLGGTTDDLADAMGTLTDRGIDALEGSKTYQKEFKRLGITMGEVKSSLKEGPMTLFELYVSKAGQVKDQTQAIASAVRLFGDDLGRRLLPALVSQGESLGNIIKLTQQFGLVLSKDQIDKLALLNVQFRKGMFFVTGFARKLSAQLAPAVLAMSRYIEMWIIGLERVINTRFAHWAKMIGEELQKLVVYAKAFYKMIGGDKTLSRLVEAFTNLAPAIMVVGAGFAATAIVKVVIALFATLTAKAAALAAMVAMVSLAVEDVIAYFNGVDSVTGRLADRFPKVKSALDALKKAWDELSKELDRVKAVFAEVMAEFNEEGADGMTTFEWILSSVIRAVVTLMTAIVYLVKAGATLTRWVMGIIKPLMQLNNELNIASDNTQKALIMEEARDAGITYQQALLARDKKRRERHVSHRVADSVLRHIPLSGSGSLVNTHERLMDEHRRDQAKAAIRANMNRAVSMDPMLNPIGMTGPGLAAQAQAYGAAGASYGMVRDMGPAPAVNVNIYAGDISSQNAVEVGNKIARPVANMLRESSAAQGGGAR